ncbi:MAG: hypothetical protein OT477_13745 [Chloroflexi bacterium]|nr:hypothetical protein [Chloroflexota bacterium]
MNLKFEEWLVDQKGRQDEVGDFARGLNMPDVAQRLLGRKPDEHKNWADIVIGMSKPLHIATFNAAWQEFQVEKKLAADVPR